MQQGTLALLCRSTQQDQALHVPLWGIMLLLCSCLATSLQPLVLQKRGAVCVTNSHKRLDECTVALQNPRDAEPVAYVLGVAAGNNVTAEVSEEVGRHWLANSLGSHSIHFAMTTAVKRSTGHAIQLWQSLLFPDNTSKSSSQASTCS